MTLFSKEAPILAIDVANLAHRAYHANKYLSVGSEEDRKPTGHVYGSVKMLLSLIRRWTKGGKQPYLWWALEGKSTRRKKIYPEYKANRTRSFDPYAEVRKLVLKFPGLAYYHSQREADDILAMMTHPQLREKRDIILVTTDRDMWQFVGQPGVKVWCKDHIVQPSEMISAFGVESYRSVALIKALFGDPSDNIPPAFKGMRHKPMLDLINQHEVYTPKALQSYVHELPEKAQEKISTLWNNLERNWDLVKLPKRPNPKIQIRKGPSNSNKLVAYLKKFQCKSLYAEVMELWSSSS